MTDTNGVKGSTNDKLELADDGLVLKACLSGVEKEVEIGGKKHKEEREEVEEGGEEKGEKEEVKVEEEQAEEVEESEEGEGDEKKKEMLHGSVDVSDDSKRKLQQVVSPSKNLDRDDDSLADADGNNKEVHVGNEVSAAGDVGMSGGVVMKPCNNNHADVPMAEAPRTSNMEMDGSTQVKDEKESLRPDNKDGDVAQFDTRNSPNHQGVDDGVIHRHHGEVDAHDNGSSALNVKLMKEKDLKTEDSAKEVAMDTDCRNPNSSCIFDTDTSGGGESGTEDEQAAFMNALEKFHKEKFLEFKPPKFYGEPLNLLKLWRAVMRLGGYDKVTACKYWRQVGESFRPPKTCTTVSWTFRIFYEKALLEYERYRMSGVGTDIPASLPMSMSVENQAIGSGRARRDAAARAMQGWHSQRILDNGEVSDPIIKDKNSTSLGKKEKQLKSLNMIKRKKPASMDATMKDPRPKVPKSQSETTVIDIGSPADWVKINVRVTKDCYEVYALVPGLLREEVRVQSDPAGRLVISGEPENPDNPWNVTPFKKVVNLPSRIDPHQTSAVVTLHGQLFVRVPFEQYD